MRIFAGVPWRGASMSNDSNGHALRPSIIITCVLTYLHREYVSRGHAY